MITIDGSEGEGGGQVIRTSLALSMITGKPFEIQNIRGRRNNPGLARQHLTCVQAARKICAADVEGDRLKSSQLTFCPGATKPGDYQFQIGTAGSTTLVVQTVLPALLMSEQPSSLEVEGGTHNQLAPPFEFLQLAFLPLVNRLGPRVEAVLHSHGFYPNGGGKVGLSIEPARKWRGLVLMEAGKPKPLVTAIVSRLPASIAERECSTICRKAGWPSNNSEIISVADPVGPGNIVMIKLVSENVTEVFSGVGEIGIKAEQVATRVWREAQSYLQAEVPVGPHLADQLMLPCAIAAMHGQTSIYRTMPLTAHSKTHIDIIHRFLEIEISAQDLTNGSVEVRISPAPAKA